MILELQNISIADTEPLERLIQSYWGFINLFKKRRFLLLSLEWGQVCVKQKCCGNQETSASNLPSLDIHHIQTKPHCTVTCVQTYLSVISLSLSVSRFLLCWVQGSIHFLPALSPNNPRAITRATEDLPQGPKFTVCTEIGLVPCWMKRQGLQGSLIFYKLPRSRRETLSKLGLTEAL